MRKRRLVLCLGSGVVLVSIVVASLRSMQMRPSAAGVVEHPSSAGWTTRGADILSPTGAAFVIAGVSWYGLETAHHAPFGLELQDYKHILNQSKIYQFNTLRISFSNEVWETNPLPNPQNTRACRACQSLHARDILALIINYAGSIGLHVILDNHRSDAGSSTASNGLWYDTDNGHTYTEEIWIMDWVDIQRLVHGQRATLGSPDRNTVHNIASDGFPTVMGYDLRNEPHTPPEAPYMTGATWGTGDGISP